MPVELLPSWTALSVLLFLAILSLVAGAYECALAEASRARLKRRLSREHFPAHSFVERAVANDGTVLSRTAQLHSLASGAFLVYGVWIFSPDLAITGYFWLATGLVVVNMILRGLGQLAGNHWAEELVVRAALPLAILTFPMVPLSWLSQAARRILARAAGIERALNGDDELEAEVIDAVSDGQLDGVVKDGQKEMIEGIFEFKDSDVADIIVPRTEMTTIDTNSSLEEAILLAKSSGFSRLPAYKGTRDHINGILHVRDILSHWGDPDLPTLASLLRPPLFVPETKKILELLAEMRLGHSHMAIVLDEYGGTAGLVTIEDILEEIVGDIQDEFDSLPSENQGDIRRLDDNTLLAEGYTHVADINKKLGSELIPEDDDYETVAGFVLDRLGHIPVGGESFIYGERLSVTVVQADERRVRLVKFHLIPPD
ncbi:MAG: hemolysin family protein [Planctomycetota bacterium]|jgi:CBS domain containing-hemolysin-like protein|nr:hemolysin family protein [Planctomycetota bacterium]